MIFSQCLWHLVAPSLTSVAFWTCDVTGIAVLLSWLSLLIFCLFIFVFLFFFRYPVTFLADIWHAPCGPAFLVWRSAFWRWSAAPSPALRLLLDSVTILIFDSGTSHICVWVWGRSRSRSRIRSRGPASGSCPFMPLLDSLEIAPINAKHNNSIYHAQLKWFVANANDAPCPMALCPQPRLP